MHKGVLAAFGLFRVGLFLRRERLARPRGKELLRRHRAFPLVADEAHRVGMHVGYDTRRAVGHTRHKRHLQSRQRPHIGLALVHLPVNVIFVEKIHEGHIRQLGRIRLIFAVGIGGGVGHAEHADVCGK